MKLGLQLYTLRKQMQTEEEIERALERVAKIGYTCVQVSGIGKIEPERLREICDRVGIQIAATHTPSDRILEDTAGVIREHEILGCDYIGLGSIPKEYRNAASYGSYMQHYRRAAEEIAAAGKIFTYHNHAFEFERTAEKELAFDSVLKTFTPRQMMVTLDCYWVNYAGADVCDWIDRLSGRIDCVHLKDMGILNGEIVMLPVTEGNMNYPRIIEHLRAAGTRYAFVEQDNCNGEDPFDCAARSYRHLLPYFER